MGMASLLDGETLVGRNRNDLIISYMESPTVAEEEDRY